jgi:gliding motility-associated-like protein
VTGQATNPGQLTFGQEFRKQAIPETCTTKPLRNQSVDNPVPLFLFSFAALQGRFHSFKSMIMFYRIFPFIFLLVLAGNAFAQVPVPIQWPEGARLGAKDKILACANQFAGTVSFSNFVGQSNDIDLDTIYFCFGDEISIVHNGDQNLTGDPNPLTNGGITYGYFNCKPTISGPNLATILTDPCIVTNPPPINDLWITGGGQPNGNITFSNSGNSQNTFNAGNPVLLWFAPITIDKFPNQYEADPLTGEAGPCVNLNVDEAFAVVYLNEITTSNLNTNTGVSGCKGSFQVHGGLPEFDGSSHYTFSISLVGNSSIHGTVLSGPATDGSTVSFQVPVPGLYTVNIEDGKSCGGSLLANMSSCINVTQSIQSATAAPTDMICLDVTNEGGFDDLITMQYGLTWDPAVLQYSGVANLTPLLPGFTPSTSFNSLGDTLIFSWGSLLGVGQTLPPGTVLYQVCFNVVGQDGDCTNINYIAPGSPIEVVTEAGSPLGFNGIDGSVCVSNSAIVINPTATPVTCPSGMNGSITVTVNGGTAPYQVTWQNTAGGPVGGPGIINLDGGSFTANNLQAGTYIIKVTDSNSPALISAENVDVSGPPPLNLVFTNTSPKCNGESNGAVCAQLISGGIPVSNPTATYTFAWSVAGAGNNACISDLAAGSYSVTVTNNSTGCTLTGSSQLNEPSPLVANVNTTAASCSGIGDGTLSVLVSGGTPDNFGDYLIQWPNIGAGLTINGTTSNVVGLVSDSYQLVVTDANGCKIDQNYFLPAIKVLHANAVITPIDCNNPCSGSIFLTAFSTGGTVDTQYNFDWFGVPVPPAPVAETNTTTELAGLCEGTYTVVIENQDGCEIDTTFSFALPSNIVVSLVLAQNETCMPGDDGKITVSATGGNAPYTYVWDNSTSTGPTASNLNQGTYTVTVTDATGCSGSLTTTITAPVPPAILSLPDDMVTCSTSSDGSLTVTATAGSTPIVGYAWSNGGNGQTINNLPPGTYIASVSDAAGCVATDTAMVLATSQVVIDSFQTSSPQCPGLGGGNIIAFVSGGTAPYTFTWSNGPTGNGLFVNSNLTAGTYSVIIGDANGCPPAMGSVTLDDPPHIQADFSAIGAVSCANSGQTCDGTATATAMYADGSTGLFDFIWSSGETDNNVAASTAVQLCADDQRLIVSDGVCNDTFFVNIPAPPPIMPGQDVINVSCNGLSDGVITLMPSGGTPPYNIQWQNGPSGPTYTGLPAGIYTAVITDANNCNFSHSVYLIEPSPFEVLLNPALSANISCPGAADGIIAVVPQGGNLSIGSAVFLWENNVAGTDQATAEGLSAGTYSVTVVDPKGCADSLTQTISEPPPIQFRIADFAPIQCYGEGTNVTVDSVWGGNPTAVYVFSVGACVGQSPGQFCQVLGGTHVIQIKDNFNNCTVDTTITVSQPQEISVSLPPSIEIDLGDSLTTLNPTIVSSLPIDTFIWEPAENLSCADCKNPRVTGINPMTYTLTVIDINGCSATAQIFVDIDRNRKVYIPNVFSPNGDGINDKFQVYTGLGVDHLNFVRLYDRWGEKVFEELDQPPSPDGTPGWDGVFRGQDMDPAVFMYLVEVVFVDGRVLLYKGDVTLLR